MKYQSLSDSWFSGDTLIRQAGRFLIESMAVDKYVYRLALWEILRKWMIIDDTKSFALKYKTCKVNEWFSSHASRRHSSSKMRRDAHETSTVCCSRWCVSCYENTGKAHE